MHDINRSEHPRPASLGPEQDTQQKYYVSAGACVLLYSMYTRDVLRVNNSALD